MRCKNKNCKIKLDRHNTYTFVGYNEEHIKTNDFGKIAQPVKIKVCTECAIMYLGKYYDENEKFSMELVDKMEFSKEFQQDIFNKIK